MSHKYEAGMIVNVLVGKIHTVSDCGCSNILFCSKCMRFLSLENNREDVAEIAKMYNTSIKVKILNTDFVYSDGSSGMLPCYRLETLFTNGENKTFFAHEEYITTDSKVFVSAKSSGMTCFECKNGYPYAEPNFNDKLVCWSCVDSLGWKYTKNNNIVLAKT